MYPARSIRWIVAWPAVCLAILLFGCHSSTRSIRKNPRIEPFDYQISVGQDQFHIEGYLARAAQPGRQPALLVINPSGDAIKCIKSTMGLMQLDLHIACISLPGTGKSSGPGRFVGPQAVAAARRAIDLLAARADVDPARLGVWGLANGAVAAGLLMDVDPRPRVVILQSGAYDMAKFWPEARWFTKLSILHQVWPSRRVLKERSVIEHLPPRLNCKVLILHGEEDKRTPLNQAEQLATALQERGASVKTRYFPDANHKLGPRAYAEVVEFLRENLVPASASG
jgi:alpha-beta hydrolase superfamily lysophospholipase